MLTTFRRFFQSKIGIVVTMAFLALIALAFASMDVSSSATFGGVSGGNRVAVVGDEKIGTADLVRDANNAVDGLRQDDPTLSMQAFVEQGGLDRVLSQMIDRAAIAGYARDYGLRAGENLVNSEILGISAFSGPDGNFSEDAFRGFLAQRGLNEAAVRNDLASDILAQQILIPATFGATLPNKLVTRYAALQRESREGSIGFIPSTAFAPDTAPTTAQLQSYYAANRGDYIRPERRTIRYATLDAESLGDRVNPTDAEIAARYRENQAQYSASETRGFSQLIVPTQQAAEAIRQRVQAGGSLEQAAREAGLSVAEVEPRSRQQLASSTSPAVAEAVFTTERGSVAVPQRGSLGWYVTRVDSINRTPARSLAQVRGEIAEELRLEKRRNALADLAVDAQDSLDDGEALADVARELGLQIQNTRPLTAAGQVYGQQGETAPDVLGPVLPTAFQMEEGEPQVAEVTPGETFVLFDVARITGSAAAPLGEIRDEVIAEWRMAQGLAAARKAADRILARVRGGATLAEAMRAEEASLPAPENVDLSRQELAARQQQIPAPLALMFSMAEGTTKKLEGPGSVGWFVVNLADIVPGEIATDDPFIASARQQLAQRTGEEYAQQLVAAMRGELGVERNAEAIEAVRRQLVGNTN